MLYLFVCSTRLRGSVIGWGHICAFAAVPSAGYGRNLWFVQGAGDESPTLREGHRGIFNVHQRMLADGTPRDGTHIDESPWLWNTRKTVYSRVEIQTQARQLRGECAYLEAIRSALMGIWLTAVPHIIQNVQRLKLFTHRGSAYHRIGSLARAARRLHTHATRQRSCSNR